MDEEDPLVQDPDDHHGSSGPVVITHEVKGEGGHSDEVIASSSTDSPFNSHHSTEIHEEIKSRDLMVATLEVAEAGASYEEITATAFEEHNVLSHEDQQQHTTSQEMAEVQLSTQVINTPAMTTFVEEIVEDIVMDNSTLPVATAEVTGPTASAPVVPAVPVEKPVTSPQPPAPAPVNVPSSPAPTRSKTFKKLTRRSPSASVSTASSPPVSSPLMERFGRFAKIIRPSETHSSTHSKVEPLTISTPSSLAGVAAAVITAEPETFSTQIVEVEEKSMVPLTPVSPISPPVLKDLSVPSQRSEATPALLSQPEQQQAIHNSHRNSLAVDTLISRTSTTVTTSTTVASSPVAIPGVRSSWSHSPTTLHQHDGSTANSSSGHSLSRAGRASTMDSATEGGGSDVGSVNSSEQLANLAHVTATTGTKDGVKGMRRKSVLKKLGKIIDNMNTKTRKSMDGNTNSKQEKSEKRTSRHGSMTLASPLESEENFTF